MVILPCVRASRRVKHGQCTLRSDGPSGASVARRREGAPLARLFRVLLLALLQLERCGVRLVRVHRALHTLQHKAMRGLDYGKASLLAACCDVRTNTRRVVSDGLHCGTGAQPDGGHHQRNFDMPTLHAPAQPELVHPANGAWYAVYAS